MKLTIVLGWKRPVAAHARRWAFLGVAMPTLQISKLDAARRQLETAIVLYFNERDPVSVHTLTAAAHQLLTDVNKASGGPPTWRAQMMQEVKPEYRSEIQAKFAEAENFFKHADRDPSGILTFNPAQTDFWLQDACLKYRDLTGESGPLFSVYRAWFGLQYREALDPAKQKELPPVPAIAKEGRQAYFVAALPLLTTLR